MLLQIPASQGFTVCNDTVPIGSTTAGTLVTAHATQHTKGSWTEILDGAAVTAPCSRICIHAQNTFGSTVDTSALFDVAIDPSDSASYDSNILLSNLTCGYAKDWANGGPRYEFDVEIPAGTSIAARMQSIVSADTAYFLVWVFGADSVPRWRGSFSETFGANTADSGGTQIAAGNGAVNSTIGTSAGNWHSLGTTSKRLCQWALGLQPNAGGTVTGRYMAFDIGYGDATTVVPIATQLPAYKGSDESVLWPRGFSNSYYADVPAGSTIYVRGHGVGSADSEMDAIVVGVG